jgi:hypothetical protein
MLKMSLFLREEPIDFIDIHMSQVGYDEDVKEEVWIKGIN